MHAYPFTNENSGCELQYIKTTLHNNNYPTNTLWKTHKQNHAKQPPPQKKKKKKERERERERERGATFTNIGKEN
jgi:hypothetical protein